MIKQLSIGTLLALGLTGCGGSDSNSSSSPDSKTKYSIADYTAIESSSLEGTWVTIESGTHRISEFEGEWEKGSFSIKEFLIIRKTDGQLEVANCDSGFSNLTLENDSLILEGLDSPLAITNNNHIVGSVNTSETNGDYIRSTFEIVKVSNSTEPLGTINTNWSGDTESQNTEQSVFAFCAEKVDEVDYEGFKSIYSVFEFGVENALYETDVLSGSLWDEQAEKIYVSHPEITLSATGISESSVNVDFNESTTAFTGTFNASYSGVSVNVTTNIQLP